jgi:hypothetical protein
MIKCPSCSQVIPDERQSCPSCGTALHDSFTPTRRLDSLSKPASDKANTVRLQASPNASPRASLSHDSIDEAAFVAGTILAARYRIVGLLGKGGMGEVYRADDLKLGQSVALKFLPATLSTDGAALARFHREVRTARHVSHRNVCRVYDIGEVDGQHFLSMEYIKGEELSSLLRRIGHLPSDKALEIARQLCAGLAAAHDNNVLHRDLKPSNVMIDGDGNVRILDFGLAGLEEEFREDELRAGTPAYMAPEQMHGQEVTVRSDIYSLGLVLYEVFTGKRAFEARSLAELIELREKDKTPTNPSDYVKDMDPLVERVILRCLEKRPEDRPASAIQVAASLPGGDPLAAALAAGETPSPEMVAAAPKEGVLHPTVAISLFAALLILIGIAIFLAGQRMLHRMVPLEKSPEVLDERAREIARKLGYASQPVDGAYGFVVDGGYSRYLLETDRSPTRWEKLRTGQPAVVYFWQRQSPDYLSPFNQWQATPTDPPETASGMTGTLLDTRGRLLYFYGVPPQIEDVEPTPSTERPEPDWSLLFAEAGLNQSAFKQVESKWLPPHAYDKRAAWEGAYPGQPQIPVRVEAASYRGRPTYFQLINPWDIPKRQETQQTDTKIPERQGIQQTETSQKILFGLLMTIFALVILGSVALAIRNLRQGRGDRKGALRLAIFVFVVSLIGSLSMAHHVPTFAEWSLLGRILQSSIFIAAFMWFVYMALEPFVRRRWPWRIVSWTRLLAGSWRDPLVGRDILIGAVNGAALITYSFLAGLIPVWLGWPPPPLYIENGIHNMGLGGFAPALSGQLMTSLVLGLGVLFLFLLFAIILRKERLGIGAVALLFYLGIGLVLSYNPLGWLLAAGGAFLHLFSLYRYGLLAMISSELFFHLYIAYPITYQFSSWYATAFTLGLITNLCLAVYACRVSMGGQKLLRGALLED